MQTDTNITNRLACGRLAEKFKNLFNPTIISLMIFFCFALSNKFVEFFMFWSGNDLAKKCYVFHSRRVIWVVQPNQI